MNKPNPADVCIVIPARHASTRLPGKMLLDKTGKPLVQHTWEAANGSQLAGQVIVATDHPAIADAVKKFGGKAVMTSPNCASGTDRVAEIAKQMPDVGLFVNVQGDEPEMTSEAIDQVIECIAADDSIPMATLATPLRDIGELYNPANVKVVFSTSGQAFYFSRSVIPFVRDRSDAPNASDLEASPARYHQHLGIYAYRRDFLLKLGTFAPSPLEDLEKLEQLRVLEAGYSIQVAVTDHCSVGIDTPGDYAKFLARHEVRQQQPPKRLAA